MEGICDNCGSPLTHRPDDNLESLTVRLSEYDNLTAPVVTYFEEKGLVQQINAAQSMEEVWADVDKALSKVANDQH